MQEGVYSKLRNHLNNYPLWAPKSKELLEILQIMLTPEKAQLA
ncbi:hypothetical protein [uncultured Desulfosarcina sp.]|nr:hypothetical protein [uncultured Desulfosarcina sp.]